MPNYYLSVLYKHIIQVENKNVGLKVGAGGHKHTIAPPSQKSGGAHAPLALPLPTAVLIIIIICCKKNIIIIKKKKKK